MTLKTKQESRRGLKKSALLVVLVTITSFYGCSKPGITSENFAASNVMFLNFWENAGDDPLAFHLDTSKQLNYFNDLHFTAATEYLVVYSGNRKAWVSDNNSGDEIVSSDVKLDPDKIYSFFMAGSEASPETVLTEDDLTRPGDNKFKVRFANMSVGSSNVNIAIRKEDLVSLPQPQPVTTLIQGVSYKTVTPFSSVDTSSASFTVYAISNADTLAKVEGIKFLHNQGYTISLAGTQNGPLGIRLVSNVNLLTY